MSNYHTNGDGNLAALAAYERKVDARVEWEEKQVAIDDCILARDGMTPAEGEIDWLSDAEEFEEILDAIKTHRAAGKSGSPHDWQSDGCWWEHVHGAADDRTSEDD